MSNASPAAARRGFAFFTADPRPSLLQINERLLALGFGPVSERMYDHYRRLVRHDYEEYVPVNELDVAVKASRARRVS